MKDCVTYEGNSTITFQGTRIHEVEALIPDSERVRRATLYRTSDPGVPRYIVAVAEIIPGIGGVAGSETVHKPTASTWVCDPINGALRAPVLYYGKVRGRLSRQRQNPMPETNPLITRLVDEAVASNADLADALRASAAPAF